MRSLKLNKNPKNIQRVDIPIDIPAFKNSTRYAQKYHTSENNMLHRLLLFEQAGRAFINNSMNDNW